MAYEYWCGVCRTISEHSSRASATAERRSHISAVHHGRRPDRERLGPRAPLPRTRRTGPPLPIALAAAVVVSLLAWAVLGGDPPSAPHPPAGPALPTPQPLESLLASIGTTATATPSP